MERNRQPQHHLTGPHGREDKELLDEIEAANTESYDLIAYDIDTKKEVLHWRNVAVKPGAVYTANSVIIEEPNRWVVVGVRNTSTARVKQVDVRLEPIGK